MELYTFVSLIIGIFGATYAALNALRINFESHIRESVKVADDRITAVVAVRGEDNGDTKKCKKQWGKVRKWHQVWTWANAVPAIIFFLLIGFLSSWVLFAWDEVVGQHPDPANLAALKIVFPLSWFRTLLFLTVTLDFLCVALAIVSLFGSRNARSHLMDLADVITPPEGLGPPGEG